MEIFLVNGKRSVFPVSRYQHLCDFARKDCGQLYWLSRVCSAAGTFMGFSSFPLLHLPADGNTNICKTF